eukprot:scaffold2646_cov62-Phaeocystis_antarctica.AAC.2
MWQWVDLHGGGALAPLLTSAYAAPEDDGPKAEDRGPERGKEPRSAPPVRVRHRAGLIVPIRRPCLTLGTAFDTAGIA